MAELKPGFCYLTADGNYVTIIGVNYKKPAYPMIGHIHCHINNTHYTRDGRNINYFRGWDIAKQIDAWNKRS